MATKNLTGSLGVMNNFIHEPHLCVVDVPSAPGGKLSVTFIGAHAKTGGEAQSSTSITLGNDPRSFPGIGD